MAIDFPSSPTNGQTYTSGGTTWVYDSSVPAWNLQNTVISGPTGPTGPTGPVFTGYDNEIHVSGIDGNDTTGNGDLVNPVATIGKAATLISGAKNTIVVHPGTYTESVTLNTAKTFIKATNGPTPNDGPQMNGTLTIQAGANNTQVSGMVITTVVIEGTGTAAFLNFCNITTLTKTSTGLVTCFASQIGSGGSISITGPSIIRFNECSFVGGLTNNNSTSTCIIAGCKTVFNPVNTLGNIFITNSSVFGSGTYAFTSAAGSANVSNTAFFNSTGTALHPINMSGGFYSISNAQYNSASSLFTGATNANPNIQFAQATADRLITRGGTSSQYTKGDGSLESLTPVAKIADFTVATTESYLINNKSGSACVVTLPTPASFIGRRLVFTNYQAQTIDSAGSNVVPITGGSPGTAIVGATAGAWATLVSDGTNWLIVERG